MTFSSTPPISNPVETLIHKPWTLFVEPFQVAPNTFYVSGQCWVGCYLIDTGDGLILIDTAIPESCYLLLYSIYKLGYQITDLKKILISHAHFDHLGAATALKELSGAELYLSKEDYEFMKACPEETYLPDSGSHVQLFKPDCLYSDNQPISLGNITLHTLLTPGHTIGCTSFFWTVQNPITKAVYHVAMHGGVGTNTMTDDYYANSHYLTKDLREQFIQDARKLQCYPVDIALPSHPNQIQILDRAGQYSHKNQPYLDSTIWADFLEERIQQVLQYYT